MTSLLDTTSLRARFARRSFWQLRYTNGRIINEWELDWSLMPHEGRQAVRLYCPNGDVAELGNDQDATGRLFQLKGAVLTAGVGRYVDFQLIGLVDQPDGGCQCAVWEYRWNRLRSFRDNVNAMRYPGVGRLNFEVLGLRAS